jgi:metal-responsive CopG/Arc/MetJ family transcriptional regulator
MKKERVFTFKTDEELAMALDDVPNRSEFIRKAIEVALEKRCPLCGGAGSLTPAQHDHMQHFLTVHSLEKCEECNAVHFVCKTEELKSRH